MRDMTFLTVSNRLAVFVLVLLMAAGASARAAEPSVETPSSKLADNIDKRVDLHRSLRERSIGPFEQMCEFIELSSGQREQAMELFESRIEQMSQIFMASREGKLNQKEMQEKLKKSYIRHSKDFVNILNSQQRDKLKLWEKERSEKSAKS
jgi:hypothetical protein